MKLNSVECKGAFNHVSMHELEILAIKDSWEEVLRVKQKDAIVWKSLKQCYLKVPRLVNSLKF